MIHRIIWIFLHLLILFCFPGCVLFLTNFFIMLSIMSILWCLGGRFCRNVLDSFDVWCNLIPMFLYFFVQTTNPLGKLDIEITYYFWVGVNMYLKVFNVLYMKFGKPEFDVLFRIIMSSWLIVPFLVRMKCLIFHD